MNRQQRRKTIKEGVTSTDLKILYETTKKESVTQAVHLYGVAVAMVLHDKYGYGEVRLKRFESQVQDLIESINDEYITIKDCEKVLLEECKINYGAHRTKK